jgi:hypothetical protein
MKDKKQILDIEKIKSIRGGEILLCEGYKYNFSTRKGNFSRWRCAARPCPGVLYLFENNYGFVKNQHNHVQDEQLNKALKAKEKMAVTAVTNELPPRIVIATATERLSQEESKRLPCFKSCARTIQNIRKKNLVGASQHEEEMPFVFRQTLRNENFVQYDSGKDNLSCFNVCNFEKF